MAAFATLNQRPRRVFVVDDHPIIRKGLAQLLDKEPDLDVCGEAEDVRQARAALQKELPDVLVVDLSLKESDGIELIKDVRNRYKSLPLLVLSMHDEMIYAERMLAAGANGYIMKHAASEQLLIALRRVLGGGIYVSEAVGAAMIEKFALRGRASAPNPEDRLSDRELQVLNMIGRGQSTREIAEALNLSIKTIESHRQRIKKKLSLQTAAQLMQYAVNWYSRPDGRA
jgi:DNA-binding NarL/FixJ family response regulator